MGLFPRAPACRAVLLVLLLVAVALVALGFARGRTRVPAARVGGAAPKHSAAPSCFPAAVTRRLVAAARGKSRGFAPPSAAERTKHAAAAKRLAAEFGVPVPARTLASIHGQEVAARARRRTAQKRDPAIRAARQRRLSPAAIGKELGLPPMFVVRRLARLGLPVGADEMRAAERADAGSAFHQRRAREHADAYEAEVGRALARLGATFKTETDLRAADIRLTPDFLLDTPLAIGGKKIAWIDAKNYAYYGNRLTLPGLRRQARKYTDAFGPGAMVFAGGVACDAPPLGALALGPGWPALARA